MASSTLIKAIVGSTQSKYAAWAISLTILVLCVSVLVMQTEVPFGKRLLGVLFMILITVPGVVLSLVELTCLVTGGSWKTNWWCWLLAWVIAIIVIVWCLVIIATVFNTLITYTNAKKKIVQSTLPATEEESNDFAENILENANNIAADSNNIDVPESEIKKLQQIDVLDDDDENIDDILEDIELTEQEVADLDSQPFMEESVEMEKFSNCKRDHLEKFSNCKRDHLEKFRNKKLKRREKFSNKKKMLKNRK